MPRRPSKRGGGKPGRGGKPPSTLDRRDARVRRWETADDIPLDAADQFDAAKDRILLEGEQGGEDEDMDDEEVFALNGLAEDADEDEDEDDDEDDAIRAAPAPSARPSRKSKAAKARAARADSSSEREDADEDEDEGWGTKKAAYYASNADDLASDDEEANAMEEDEARRLQSKARSALTDDAFGLADVPAAAAGAADDLDEPTEQQPAPPPQDKQAALRALAKDSPETLALARDWADVAWVVSRAQQKLDQISADPEADGLSLGMVHLHHQALLTYAATLAFYLHLRASPQYARKPEALRAHPVMARLLVLKQALSTLEDLDFALSDDEDEDEEDDEEISGEVDEDEEELTLDAADARALAEFVRSSGGNLELGELEALLRDTALDAEQDDAPPARRARKAAASAHAIAEPGDAVTPAPVAEKPAKKTKKKAKAAALPVFDLVEPSAAPAARSKSGAAAPSAIAPADAFGELAALPAADALDKSARRRSLQFHAAQVVSGDARRAAARAAASGGDTDIPYRARERGQQKKPLPRGALGADLDGEDAPARAAAAGVKRPREDDDEGAEGSADEDGEGYYSLVKRHAGERKAAKKAAHDAEAAASKINPEDAVDGPRGASRAILSNKGLTPRRPKTARNPRVKKRMKFEQAKKKVASQRAVFKPGQDAGAYAGERSGISRVVKSARL